MRTVVIGIAVAVAIFASAVVGLSSGDRVIAQEIPNGLIYIDCDVIPVASGDFGVCDVTIEGAASMDVDIVIAVLTSVYGPNGTSTSQPPPATATPTAAP